MPKSDSCYACGGMVDEDGKAFGGEVPELEGLDVFTNEQDEDDEDTNRAKFVSAIEKKGK